MRNKIRIDENKNKKQLTDPNVSLSKLGHKKSLRPLPKSGIQEMGQWIVSESWETVFLAETAHDKASALQKLLLDNLDKCLPKKTIKITSDDQPWFSNQLKKIDRKRKREFHKHRKSNRWKHLNKQFRESCSQAKKDYYLNIVQDLKTSNSKQWYSKVKSNIENDKSQKVIVESMEDKPDNIQAEIIADQFSKISNEYSALISTDIQLEQCIYSKVFKNIEAHEVYQKNKGMKTKSSTVLLDDIPMKLIKEFGVELYIPLADILNRAIEHGEYQEI